MCNGSKMNGVNSEFSWNLAQPRLRRDLVQVAELDGEMGRSLGRCPYTEVRSRVIVRS